MVAIEEALLIKEGMARVLSSWSRCMTCCEIIRQLLAKYGHTQEIL